MGETWNRLQFLDFQLDLIDEFRLRLAQLKRDDFADALDSDLPAILNTIHYISTVLAEWGSDMVSSLYIYYALTPKISAFFSFT